VFFLSIREKHNWSLLCNQLTEEGKTKQNKIKSSCTVCAMCTAPPSAALSNLSVWPSKTIIQKLWWGVLCSKRNHFLQAVSLLYLLNSTCRQAVCLQKQSLQAPKQLLHIYIYICVVFGPEKLVYILYYCTQYEC
jgi:hypothetical protein